MRCTPDSAGNPESSTDTKAPPFFLGAEKFFSPDRVLANTWSIDHIYPATAE